MHGLLTYYEVMHWRLVSRAILYNVQLKVDLLSGRVLHKRDFNVTYLVCDEGAIGSAPRLRDNPLHNRNAFTVPFFSWKGGHHLIQSQVGPLLSYFLKYSPELTLGSGILGQSERVFLLFSFKLVLFSSIFFDLDANFIGIWPFLDFWGKLLDPRVFSSGMLALSAFWQEGLSFPRLALRNLHLFLLKMLITATTAVTLPEFAVLIAIWSAFVVSLRALLRTLLGWGLWDI
jgi:hypothetical protein